MHSCASHFEININNNGSIGNIIPTRVSRHKSDWVGTEIYIFFCFVCLAGKNFEYVIGFRMKFYNIFYGIWWIFEAIQVRYASRSYALQIATYHEYVQLLYW